MLLKVATVLVLLPAAYRFTSEAEALSHPALESLPAVIGHTLPTIPSQPAKATYARNPKNAALIAVSRSQQTARIKTEVPSQCQGRSHPRAPSLRRRRRVRLLDIPRAPV